MKIFKRILSGILAAALVFTGLPAVQGTDRAEAAYTLSGDVKYLSDMNYVSGSAKDNKFRKDRNSNNQTIKLVMSTSEDKDGNTIQNVQSFIKGIGAWATSDLVYEIPSGFEYFEAHIGVDAARQENYYNGGVTFRIYLSNNLSDWGVPVYTSETLKGWNVAETVKIKVSDYSYIKLYADENGNSFYSSWYDDAVYANARFTKNNYAGESITLSDKIKTVADYDTEIAGFISADSLSDEQKLTVLQREYVDRIGYSVLSSYYTLSRTYANAVDWLIGDISNLQPYLDVNLGSSENYANSLKILAELYSEYGTEFGTEIYKKMAIALSCSHVNGVSYWASGGESNGSDAVERYRIYKELLAERRLNSDFFDTASIPEMRIIMGNQISDDQIEWLNWFAASGKGTTAPNYASPNLAHGSYIKYNSKLDWDYNKSTYFSDGHVTDAIDSEYKLSEHNVNTSDSKLWAVMKEGAVCGGQSKTGANLRGVYGIPSFVIGQPGHAAYFYQSENTGSGKKWTIGNNIYGWWKSEYGGNMLGWTAGFNGIRWAGATGPDGRYYAGSYLLLEQGAVNNIETLRNSRHFVYMAKATDDVATKERLYNKAIGILPINVEAWLGLIDVTGKKIYDTDDEDEEPEEIDEQGKRDREYEDLAKRIATDFKYHPLPMSDLLTMIKNNFINDTTKKVEIENLRKRTLEEVKDAETLDTLQPDVAKDIAKNLLSTSTVEMATFSLDGDDAGKIIFDESYRTGSTTATFNYSLSGARTDADGNVHIEWKSHSEGIIQLSDEEIESLSEENGIFVKLEGLSDANLFSITLTRAEKPEGLGANDDDDVVLGATNTMEWSLDEGENWTRFDKEKPDLTGVKTVWVRNGSTGHTLYSKEHVELDFTESDEPDDRKYVSALNIKVGASTNHNQNTLAENVLDGNVNTYWSSKQRAGADGYKRLVFTFDKERFITSVDIYPQQNVRTTAGKIRTLEIGVSTDTECSTVSVLERIDMTDRSGNEPLTVTFDKPVYAKYLYMKEADSDNDYICISMVKFYEDRTKDPENEEDTNIDWDVDEVVEIVESELFKEVELKTGEDNRYITSEIFKDLKVLDITFGYFDTEDKTLKSYIISDEYVGVAILQIRDEDGTIIEEGDIELKTGMVLEVFNGTKDTGYPDFRYIIVVPGDSDGDLTFDDHFHDITDTWRHDANFHWKGCDGCDETKDYGPHDREIRNAEEPTATEEGYTGDVYCTVCKKLLESGRIIEPLGGGDGNGEDGDGSGLGGNGGQDGSGNTGDGSSNGGSYPSGSGNSGSYNTSTPATISSNVQISESSAGSVNVSVSGSSALISAISMDTLNEVATNTESTGFEFDLSAVSGGIRSVTLMTDTVSNIANLLNSRENNKTNLTISLRKEQIVFDAKALSAIAGQAKGKSVVININTNKGRSILNADQLKTVDEINAAKGIVVDRTIELIVTSAGKVISDFKGGAVKIGIMSYSISGKRNIAYYHVYQLLESGEAVQKTTWHDSKDIYFNI